MRPPPPDASSSLPLHLRTVAGLAPILVAVVLAGALGACEPRSTASRPAHRVGPPPAPSPAPRPEARPAPRTRHQPPPRPRPVARPLAPSIPERRFGGPRLFHRGVQVVSFLMDGQVLLTRGPDGARLFRVPGGDPLAELATDLLEVSPDRRTLLVRVAGVLELRRAATGEKVGTVPGQVAVFGRDGSELVVLTAPGRLTFWSVAEGRALATVALQAGDVGPLVRSQDGRHVATGTALVDVPRRAAVPLGAPLVRGSVRRRFFSPQGRWYLVQQELAVHVWDATSGAFRHRLVHRWHQEDEEIWATTVHPSDRTIFLEGGVGPTRGLHVFDLGTGKPLPAAGWGLEVDLREGTAGPVLAVLGYCPRGPASLPSAARLLRLETARSSTVVNHCFQEKGDDNVSTFALSRDARTLAVVNASGGLKLWNVPGRRLLGAVPKRHGAPVSLSLSPDGALLALAMPDGGVDLFRVRDRAPLAQVGHGYVAAMALDLQGKRLVTGGVGLEVRDTSTGAVTTVTRAVAGGIRAVTFDRTGRIHVLAGGGQSRYQVTEYRQAAPDRWVVGRTVRLGTDTIAYHDRYPAFSWFRFLGGSHLGLCLNPERLPEGETRGSLLDLSTGKLVDTPSGYTYLLPSQGRILLLAENRLARTRAGTEEEEELRSLPEGYAPPLAVSPAGTHVALVVGTAEEEDPKGTRAAVEVLPMTGRSLRVLERPWPRTLAAPASGSGPFGALAFAHRRSLLAIASNEGVVSLLDPTTGRPVAPPLVTPANPARDLAVSPDDRHLYSLHQDGSLQRWTLPAAPAPR